MWPAAAWMGWPAPGTQMPAPRRCRPDVVVARTRHPTFSPELAAVLVATLSCRELRRLWRTTTGMLGDPTLSSTHRLNLVILRAQVLDRLDAPR